MITSKSISVLLTAVRHSVAVMLRVGANLPQVTAGNHAVLLPVHAVALYSSFAACLSACSAWLCMPLCSVGLSRLAGLHQDAKADPIWQALADKAESQASALH